MHPIRKCFLWALVMTLFMVTSSASNDRAIIEENQAKALLTYNIAKFTVWPPESAPSDAPFTFSLSENEAMAKAFQVIEGQQVNGRTVKVSRDIKERLFVDSEVLIISKHQLQAFVIAKDELYHSPILTVTADPEIFDAGAMVLIEVVDDRLSFSVNLGRVKASGLEISGNLLRHAQEVNF
jgi:hypothetical protein